MTRFITHIGKVGDVNRLTVRISPRLGGAYGGTLRREGFAVGIYGKDLEDALLNSLTHIQSGEVMNSKLKETSFV